MIGGRAGSKWLAVREGRCQRVPALSSPRMSTRYSLLPSRLEKTLETSTLLSEQEREREGRKGGGGGRGEGERERERERRARCSTEHALLSEPAGKGGKARGRRGEGESGEGGGRGSEGAREGAREEEGGREGGRGREAHPMAPPAADSRLGGERGGV